ncbi:DUF5590 domain-containing protein [Paenibacillus sp. EPM92]|uniref:cell wall elongation regulator TseB-like domain-containing protein n=1 Tax=Paenibacillus sp. EPM92 TaxID=1561195 RepID=UPI0006D0F882|nr:DUF5590 domain-containing protein [Paenibacillus sp. EPM92]
MRKRWKWSLSAAAILIVAAVGFNWLYRAVSADEWTVQRAAVISAYEKTVLTKAVKVERFISDKSYTVITGENKLGQPVYVWVGENEIRTEMAASGIPMSEAAAKVTAKHPSATILRATPGIMNDKPVWEVFYKLTPEGQDREQHFYDYYQFQDGAWIDTWRLSIQ